MFKRLIPVAGILGFLTIALAGSAAAGSGGGYGSPGPFKFTDWSANASLTARETDVLELLLEGLATVEIGRKLFLTPPTVRSHVAALLRKFGVRDREALRARFAEADPLRQADRL